MSPPDTQFPRARAERHSANPPRLALCKHPDGHGDYLPLTGDEPMPESCFMDCDCTPPRVRPHRPHLPPPTF